MMLTGRVVQFDESRGYGFITPDVGGEDVFVHVNMMGSDRWSLAPGVPVEFDAVDSERGPKALLVRVLGERATSAAPAPGAATAGHDGGTAQGGIATMVPATPPTAAAAGSVARASDHDSEDSMCDLLSERAFRIEITESLLLSMPDLTAKQLVAVRQEMLALSRQHGWVEEEG